MTKHHFSLWLLIVTRLTLHAAPETDSIPITILHTNDVHGHAWASRVKGDELSGGLAAAAALVDKIRAQVHEKGGVTLLLSAGDVNTGVPESDLLNAEPDLRAMSMMAYDAMVIGNHDLDGGMEKLDAQQAWINFPLLTANITRENSNPIRSPFIIVEKKDLKFGILGLTTDTLKRVVLGRHTKKLDVLDPIETARTYIPKIKEQGANVIIALTHLGVNVSGKRPAEKIGKDDGALLKQIPEIDVVIGGHSHSFLSEGIRVNGRLIAQAGEHGHYLGRVDMYWNQKKGKIERLSASVLPVKPSAGESSQVRKMLDEQRARVAKMLDAEIGVTQNELIGDREYVRHEETNLGNLICDILREISKAEACLFNGGGIRSGIPKGPIRLRDVFRVLPFRNTVVTGVLTGKQIKNALQVGLRHQDTTGSFLQVSGLRYGAKKGVLLWAKLGKVVLDDAAKVKIVSNNFLFEGGDFMDPFTKAADIHDTGIPVDEYFTKYIKAHPTVYAQKDGRIQLE